MAPRTVSAYVALGSNLGDRKAHLEAALAALRALPGVEVVAVSSVHETEPVGGPAQGRFLNAAAALRTELSPRALLAALQGIERAAGRERTGERNAPRTLDLDLLFYGDVRIEEPGLRVPHPRCHERPFVLEPLREIAPDLVHPVLGETIEQLARRTSEAGSTRPRKEAGASRPTRSEPQASAAPEPERERQAQARSEPKANEVHDAGEREGPAKLAIVAVSISPVGEGVSVSRFVRAAYRVLEGQEGVRYRLDPMFTTLEGDLDEIFALVRRMQEAVFAEGAVRVSTVIKVDDRRDRPASMREKVAAVEPGGGGENNGSEP